MSDKLGLKPVNYNNCEALMKLIDYERSNPYFIFGRDKKYNMLIFEVDTLNLNASFESIGGKVDIDWMLRVSVVPGLYYIAKPAWNVANNVIGVKNSKYRFTPFIGMDEEGHRNAPGAAMFYLIHKGDGMTMEKMFKPAIDNCKCMLNK